MLHKQEGNYKLHKPTNYKSNYTSIMYVEVNTSLCNEDAKQQGDKDDTMIFLPRFMYLPTR